MRHIETIQNKRNRAQAVGLLLASASIPKTFQRSLMPRSDVDQALITGITIALVYMLSTVLQDVTELGLDSVVEGEHRKNIQINDTRLNDSAVIGFLSLVLGYWLQSKFPYKTEERLTVSVKRTGGYWLKNIGLANLVYGCIEAINNKLSRSKTQAQDRNLIPYVIGAGLIFSLLDDLRRTDQDRGVLLRKTLKDTRPVKIVALGAVVTAALFGFAHIEQKVAKIVDATTEEYAPFAKRSWLPVGHVLTAGIMVFGLAKAVESIYKRIEDNSENIEEGYHASPKTRLSSGGKGSAVNWQALTIQGRRHIGSKLSSAHIADVMKESALEPIRIFVGLDSASSEEERVALALHELDRTQAFSRSHIVVVSPTGTGYINYVMSESIEYMTRGDVASVAIQYSKRPSPMSLDRVDEGFRQYRMLLNGIKRKLDTLPAKKRPKIILFGESLGAWTSQNAFINEGTDGLQYLAIDSALWIGTPAGSKWKKQVLSGKMLNVESSLVGSFDNINDTKKLRASERSRIRYVLLTHHNDPIPQFSLDLLLKQPEWIDDPNKRPAEMQGKLAYRTPTLFVQMLFGMKNALRPVPGKFVASGHDYRADLARFIKFTYRFDVSPAQLKSIEKQLRRNEIDRANKIDLGIIEDQVRK